MAYVTRLFVCKRIRNAYFADVKVQIVKNTFIRGRFAAAGSVEDVDLATAQALFDSGKAEPTDGREKEPVTKVATIDNRDPKPSRRGK